MIYHIIKDIDNEYLDDNGEVLGNVSESAFSESSCRRAYDRERRECMLNAIVMWSALVARKRKRSRILQWYSFKLYRYT